jgi:hypothetical protein
MPRFDGTGPSGYGPGTGWGLGPCGGGMGWRRSARRSPGAGGGWGRRFWGWPGAYPAYSQNLSKKEELSLLEEEADALQEEMKEIKERINELRAKK